MTNKLKNNNSKEGLTQLGSYVIESTLGQGGMGIVYRATDSDLGREVAIKVLHPHLLRHENLKQRFRREARMHAKLMHPNIVTLLSLYEDETHMALVMELIQGHDLKILLQSNPKIPLAEKLRIAMDVLSGLDAAHQNGMVHRDLKPANVIVSKQGEVKLLDFGLAKPEQGDDDLTQSGATVGSFRYMAPEQILNNPIDARTDLYAFGILLFFMTVGKLPFDTSGNGGEFEIMEKQVREPAPVPHELNRNIPVSLSNLILRLLEKNKYERPENVAAVKKELSAIQNELQSQSAPQVEASPTIVEPEPTYAADNNEIAKQWIQHIQIQHQSFWSKVIAFVKTKYTGLTGIALTFTLLGALVLIVLGMAENNTEHSTKPLQTAVKPTAKKTVDVKPVAVKPVAEKPAEVPPLAVKPVAEKPVEVKPVAVKPVTEKPVEVKPAAVKPVVKPKPRKTARSLPYSVKHSVSRSDGSTVSSKRKHEFRGGSHVFYPELAEKGWFSSYKEGETMLTFTKPTRLSKIIVHKASVGKVDFRKGFIHLEIKAPDSDNWKRLFEREDDDIDTRLTFRNIHKHMKTIESIRIRFKTYDPITIGPIDLIR